MLRLAIMLLLTAVGTTGWVAQPIAVDPRGTRQPLEQGVEYYIDTSGTLTVEEALHQSYALPRRYPLNLSILDHPVWIRFALQSAAARTLILELSDPSLERIEVYEGANYGQLDRIFRGGFDEPFHHKLMESNRWLFPLDFAAGEIKVYLLRVHTNFPLKVPLSVTEERHYIPDTARFNLIWGLYLGLLVFAFLYNLFLYFSIRENTYLFYCCYVLFGSLFYAGLQGYTFQYLWPEQPELNRYLPILICLTHLSVFLFSVSFLNITRQNRLAYYGGWSMMTLFILAIGINLTGSYGITVVMAQLLSLLTSVYYLYLAVFSIYSRVPNARYFALAWVQFLIMVVVYILADNGVIASTPFTTHSLFIGNALEVLLFSYALAARVSYLKSSNAEQQREIIRQLEANHELQRATNEKLERLVTERTIEVIEQRNEAVKQRNLSDALLLNILPEETARELKNTGTAHAQYFDSVSVLFSDVVDFTVYSSQMSPRKLVAEINTLFTAFDQIACKHGIEKIKTIGDCYMAAAGLPTPCPDHALRVIRAARDMQAYTARQAKRRLRQGKLPLQIRIGIASGPVVAGVVGHLKFAYDIWGATVNLASRMEANGVIGHINVSASTHQLISQRYQCTGRGKVKAKGFGEIEMYLVDFPTSPELSDTQVGQSTSPFPSTEAGEDHDPTPLST